MPRGANAAYGADGLVSCGNFPELVIVIAVLAGCLPSLEVPEQLGE